MSEEWIFIKENKEMVRKMLKKGRYDDASLTGWGRLDELVVFLEEFRFFNILNEIDVDVREGCDIPRWFINNTLALKLVIGEKGINSIQDGMFKDVGVLRLIGCTAREIREGFDTSRNKENNKPCNVDSLRYSVNNTESIEFVEAFRKLRGEVWKHRYLRSYVYLMDATKMCVDGDYAGAGEMVTVKDVLKENGEVKREVKKEKGFKLVTLNRLLKGQVLPEAARNLPINEHEITVSDELVDEIIQERGEGSIKILLIDRGFLDGERLRRWKLKGIDVIVPLRERMNILDDMRGLRKIGGVRAERGKDLVVWGFSDLETLESYDGKLNGLLVTQFRGKEIEPAKEWGFVTTLPVNTQREVLFSYDCYDDRSLVENKQYRELKQGWFLKHFSGKTESLIAYHIHFSLMMLMMISLYRITNIEKLDHMLEKGIRRLRRDYLGGSPLVIVYVNTHYGIFEFLEFMSLLGRPPTGKLDNIRFRFRL